MSVSFIKEDGSLRSQSGHYLHEGRGDLHALRKLVVRQAALSNTQLIDQQAQLLGPRGLLMNFGRQIARLGRQAPLLEDLLELEDGERMELAEHSVRFVLGQHERCTACDNPFSGNTRELLCCVVFDEDAPYTLAERYAASEALRQLDAQFFFRLIATTVNTVERRFVFQGLLEHFDRLLPIEQSIYPPDYRQVQQKHLEREEALYGKLELDKPVSKLLEEHSPEWLLENISTVNTLSG